uniref:GRAM domain containing 1B n=1 Tax=Lepisosteus oculatus TaxID=7918 RepID=W5M303_LEPOC
MATSTASNSNRSTPACSPILRKRSRSPTPQNVEGENMVEKGSDHSSDKSPSTPEQGVQRTYSVQSARSSGKNSKKSQSWYNVLSPTYKQRNEDFRKLFKQLPDTERLIVDYSCALQRDILLQGRLYLSENWICFYSNIFRWETLLTVRLKDICSMTKEKTARLIPNAIQVCTDTEKHFFTSFGARDRTYMMMFRLWQNALLDKPLCPKELWHFVHQCYGNELGLTSDDEDYVPPDDDFNTMGYCEEIPAEETEGNDSSSKSSMEVKPEVKPEASPLLPKKSVTNSTLTSTGSSEAPPSFDIPVGEDDTDFSDLLLPQLNIDKNEGSAPVNSPSLDFNDNEDLPTELSDSSETHDEGEVQAFYEDLNGRQYINEVFKFSVDKMYDILFTESQFMRDFLEKRRFSGVVKRSEQINTHIYCISLPGLLAVYKTSTGNRFSQNEKEWSLKLKLSLYFSQLFICTNVQFPSYFSISLSESPLCLIKRSETHGYSPSIQCRNQISNFNDFAILASVFINKFWVTDFDAIQLSYITHLSCSLNSNCTSAETPVPILYSHFIASESEMIPCPQSYNLLKLLVKFVLHMICKAKVPLSKALGSEASSRSLVCAVLSVSSCCCVFSHSLVLLVFLNMMLFYKLWMLEYTTQSLTTWQGLRLHESKMPQSQMEWAQLLESQQRYHDAELQKWREIIKSSVLLLDQMKDSLLNLQKGIGLRDYSSETEEKRSRYH